MITCRELVDFLMSYLDGELPEAKRADFEAHLADCPDCERYLSSYRDTVRLGKAAFRDLDDEALVEGMPERLVQAILATVKKTT
jgi:anti-sigma factor RsiW